MCHFKQTGRKKTTTLFLTKQRNWRRWPGLHPCRCTVDPRLTSQVNIILLCITSHSSYQPMNTPGCQGLATVESQWKTSVSVFFFPVLHGNGRQENSPSMQAAISASAGPSNLSVSHTLWLIEAHEVSHTRIMQEDQSSFCLACAVFICLSVSVSLS